MVISACREDADMALVLDGSGSVGSANFELMKDFLKLFIESWCFTVSLGFLCFKRI